MQQQGRTKNSSGKKSSRSKKSQESMRGQSGGSTNEFEATEPPTQMPSTSEAPPQRPICDEYAILPLHLIHEEFLIDSRFDEYKQQKAASSQKTSDKVYRKMMSELRNDNRVNRQQFNEMESLWDSYQDVVDKIKSNLTLCDVAEAELDEKSTMVNILRANVIEIKSKIDDAMLVKQKTAELERMFDEEVHRNEEELKKLNAEIDVVSQMRDSACLQISTTDNIMAENLLKVQEFRKLNEGLKNGISALNVKIENKNRSLYGLFENVSGWLRERTAAHNVLEAKRVQTLKETSAIRAAIKAQKAESDRLNEMLKIPTKQLVERELHIARVQAANKNLISLEEAKAQEHAQKMAKLADDIEKLKVESAAKQSELDKNRTDYDDLKAIIAGIATKKLILSDLGKEEQDLKLELFKQRHKISIMEEYINETKTRGNKIDVLNSFLAKRPRISVYTSSELNNSIRSGQPSIRSSQRDSHSLNSADVDADAESSFE